MIRKGQIKSSKLKVNNDLVKDEIIYLNGFKCQLRHFRLSSVFDISIVKHLIEMVFYNLSRCLLPVSIERDS